MFLLTIEMKAIYSNAARERRGAACGSSGNKYAKTKLNLTTLITVVPPSVS